MGQEMNPGGYRIINIGHHQTKYREQGILVANDNLPGKQTKHIFQPEENRIIVN